MKEKKSTQKKEQIMQDIDHVPLNLFLHVKRTINNYYVTIYDYILRGEQLFS